MKNTSIQRPPIVAILGHVDHGKTTLLDKIRNTNLAAKEAGGITQSIGAWQVATPQGKKITFIDTPGHEAFAKMRSRGAKVADIVVLVVAADDGVMPQTEESHTFIKEAKVPFLVAITKIDQGSANPERVKKQLVEKGVLLEGKGGDIVVVEVSGVTGEGIDTLLEMIALVSEISEVRADPEAPLEAPVIETLLDRRRGPVVRVVVRNGTLRVGDVVGGAKVRGLFDENQKPIKEALPGMPVEVLGFKDLPAVGSVVGEARYRPVPGEAKEEKAPAGGTGRYLPVILKADTAGSLEAIVEKLKGKVFFLSKGVGDISESDVLLAKPSDASIIGFNVRLKKEVRKLAEEEEVRIHTYKVIYELLGEVDLWIREKERGTEEILGKAAIIAEFPYEKKRVAGCRVLEGRIASPDRLRLVRDGQVLGTSRPASLRVGKDRVGKVDQGQEFGVLLEPQVDFRVGDVLESTR